MIPYRKPITVPFYRTHRSIGRIFKRFQILVKKHVFGGTRDDAIHKQGCGRTKTTLMPQLDISTTSEQQAEGWVQTTGFKLSRRSTERPSGWPSRCWLRRIRLHLVFCEILRSCAFPALMTHLGFCWKTLICKQLGLLGGVSSLLTEFSEWWTELT